MKMKPFKLLRNDCSLDLLCVGFAELGFDLTESVHPDNAHEDSVLLFQRNRPTRESVKIVIEKQWWPDGDNWEDAAVSLRYNESELTKIDLQQLLREKLERPLRELVRESLLDAVSETSLANT